LVRGEEYDINWTAKIAYKPLLEVGEVDQLAKREFAMKFLILMGLSCVLLQDFNTFYKNYFDVE
jgi:hypothetical protein